MLHTTSSTPPSPSFALNEVEWTSDDESSSSNASSASRNDGAPVIRLTASHVSYRRAAVACEEERLARVNRTQDFVSHTQTERAHARHQANEVADRQGDLRRRVHHAAHKQEASQHTPSERHIADHEARTTHSLPSNAPIEAIELTPSTPYLSLPLPSSQSSSPSENGPYRPLPDPYWSEPARAQVEYDHAAGPSPVTVRPAATQQPHVRHHAPPQFDSPYWQPHPLHHSSDPRPPSKAGRSTWRGLSTMARHMGNQTAPQIHNVDHLYHLRPSTVLFRSAPISSSREHSRYRSRQRYQHSQRMLHQGASTI
ncbi:hypothetical protein BD626DRAFT_215546 [Schizophyllum amplum]|uniref:Uncharacterized protein n=1 Tax=Schizophyllum amplum TaxID=97359 RepID=A0A550CKA9_9AGAR|nr:hypothetical protein BD626DRAFT_215546 [Auriculariopsis ampla]